MNFNHDEVGLFPDKNVENKLFKQKKHVTLNGHNDKIRL